MLQANRLWTVFVAIVMLLFGVFPASAQDNLLNNGGLEEGEFGPYLGRGRGDLNIPAGWDIWLGQGDTSQFMNRGDQVYGFPHTGPGPAPVEGDLALNLDGGFVQFNAAVYQRVGVAPGTILRAEATSQVKTCSPPGGGEGFCGSDPSSGSRTRIGIDPDGGTDPNSGDIIWSAWLEPHDRWDSQAVEATSAAGEVTVFLYATQGGPFPNNKLYWDDVKLIATGTGEIPEAAEGGEEGGGGADTLAQPAPPANVVPFVVPQSDDDGGRVVHTVQQGETLDSIAVAYGLSRQDIIDRNPELNNIQFLQIGQRLTIEEGEAAPAAEEEAEEAEEEAEEMADDAEAPESEGAPDTDVLLDEVASIFQGQNADETSDAEEAEAEEEEAADETEPVDEMAEADDEEMAADEEDTEEAMDEEEEMDEEMADAPAPVVDDENVIPSVDLTTVGAVICVSMFEDTNQNRIRESNERLLSGGGIDINLDGETVASYETDGSSEPHCINELAAGDHTAFATAPDGYGITTANNLQLPLTVGASLNIAFGAAEGVEVAMAPPPDSNVADDTLVDPQTGAQVAQPDGFADQFIAISGIIVAALAGVVVLAGIGATLVMRRQ